MTTNDAGAVLGWRSASRTTSGLR